MKKITLFVLILYCLNIYSQKKVITYYEDRYTKKEEFYLVNNEKNGKYTKYYANGRIEETGSYKNGLTHGLVKYYLFEKSNVLVKEITWVNGNMEGPFKSYFTDIGKVYQSGIHKDNKIYKITLYFESGKVNATKDENGVVKEYDENGNLIKETKE